ncbi:MAG: hypothetical protein V1898_00170 [Patescibacteria group bacterium]
MASNKGKKGGGYKKKRPDSEPTTTQPRTTSTNEPEVPAAVKLAASALRTASPSEKEFPFAPPGWRPDSQFAPGPIKYVNDASPEPPKFGESSPRNLEIKPVIPAKRPSFNTNDSASGDFIPSTPEPAPTSAPVDGRSFEPLVDPDDHDSLWSRGSEEPIDLSAPQWDDDSDVTPQELGTDTSMFYTGQLNPRDAEILAAEAEGDLVVPKRHEARPDGLIPTAELSHPHAGQMLPEETELEPEPRTVEGKTFPERLENQEQAKLAKTIEILTARGINFPPDSELLSKGYFQKMVAELHELSQKITAVNTELSATQIANKKSAFNRLGNLFKTGSLKRQAAGLEKKYFSLDEKIREEITRTEAPAVDVEVTNEEKQKGHERRLSLHTVALGVAAGILVAVGGGLLLYEGKKLFSLDESDSTSADTSPLPSLEAPTAELPEITYSTIDESGLTLDQKISLGTVHENQGPTHGIMAQLMNNPAYWGYDVAHNGSVENWAQNMSRQIAIDNGVIKVESGKIVSEERTQFADAISYVISKDVDGKISLATHDTSDTLDAGTSRTYTETNPKKLDYSKHTSTASQHPTETAPAHALLDAETSSPSVWDNIENDYTVDTATVEDSPFQIPADLIHPDDLPTAIDASYGSYIKPNVTPETFHDAPDVSQFMEEVRMPKMDEWVKVRTASGQDIVGQVFMTNKDKGTFQLIDAEGMVLLNKNREPNFTVADMDVQDLATDMDTTLDYPDTNDIVEITINGKIQRGRVNQVKKGGLIELVDYKGQVIKTADGRSAFPLDAIDQNITKKYA